MSTPDRLKANAHNMVYRAVRDGLIQKAKSCSGCGSEHQIEAHHDDYAYPLDIKWFCKSCHSNWHQEHTPATPEISDARRQSIRRENQIERGGEGALYEPLQIIANKTGLKYYWLREQAIKGTIPTVRTSTKGKWLAQEEEVRAAVQKMQTAA